MAIRLDGEWEGEYQYDVKSSFGRRDTAVPFKMTLSVSTSNEITGEVRDDELIGVPGVGQVSGRIRGDSFRFTKQYERFYVGTPGSGPAITLEESWRHRFKVDIDEPVSGVPIEYSGTWDSFGTKIFGSWFVRGSLVVYKIRGVPQSFKLQQMSGTWSASRVTWRS